MLSKKQRIKAIILAFIISAMSITEGRNICNIFINNENIVYASSNFGTYTVGNATYSYEVTDTNTIYIDEYKGTDSKVVIPEKINGKPVTAIGVYAFGECKTIEEVEIPDTVTEICSRAFIDCTNLKKVKLSENTEYIGGLAFTYCSSLESIVIPNSVTEIWDYAFYECTNLKNIQLSKNLSYLGDSVFKRCYLLEMIELPGSVKELEKEVFEESWICVVYNNSYVKNYMNQHDICAISQKEKEKIEIRKKQALQCIDENMSEEEKVLAIYDWVIRECDYDVINYENDKIPAISYSAYGVYIYGRAVCDGYAKAIKELLEMIGIETIKVSSIEMDHAWNMVKIKGSWYHLDATWDDPTNCENTDQIAEGNVSHKYFLKSDSEFNELEHYAWSEDAPECNITNSFSNYLFRGNGYNKALNYYNGYWYFQKDGVLWRSTISGNEEKVRNTNGYYYDLNAFIYEDYIYYESNGNIVKLNMKNIKNGTPELVYNFKQNYSGYYIGEFAIKDRNVVISGNNCNLNPQFVNEKIPLYEMILGDVNEDEEINIKDSALIKRYLAGVEVELDLKAADVNGDGEVTIKDSALIKRQLAGWE